MDILLLGGPSFVGRHVINAALAAGHNVTTFNRGTTNPDLYPEVRRLVGDRDGGLGALGEGRWDAVIDSSGYVPRIVRDSVRALEGRVGAYVFVSTTGVYAESGRDGCDETAATRRLADETDDLDTEDDVKHYGALKVVCEEAVQHGFGDRAVLLRPGPIVGPHDPTDRFTYWPRRAAAGGEAIVPGPPDRLAQHIDARDLAAFAVRMAEDPVAGAFNLSVPAYTFADFLSACRQVAGVAVDWIWADEYWLVAQGVIAPWELPMWLPGQVNRGRLACDPSRALAHGLRPRVLTETVADTLAWDTGRPRPLHRGPVGDRYQVIPMEPDRESELIRRLRGEGS